MVDFLFGVAFSFLFVLFEFDLLFDFLGVVGVKAPLVGELRTVALEILVGADRFKLLVVTPSL